MSETQTVEEFVEEQLKNGQYNSYEELVHAGLRLLQEQQNELNHLAEEMRPAVDRFKQGKPGIELNAEDIIQRGRKRLASKMNS